jgi:hypothetical protein
VKKFFEDLIDITTSKSKKTGCFLPALYKLVDEKFLANLIDARLKLNEICIP